MQWWERKRSKGRSNFIRWATLVWSGSMILVTTASDYFLDREFESETLILKVPIYLLGGYFVGLLGWSSNENKYQAFLRDGAKDEPMT